MDQLIRKAFVMQLHPGQVEEYRRRHDPIGPELEEVLRAQGVRSYSIFLHPETLAAFRLRGDRERGALGVDRAHAGLRALVGAHVRVDGDESG